MSGKTLERNQMIFTLSLPTNYLLLPTLFASLYFVKLEIERKEAAEQKRDSNVQWSYIPTTLIKLNYNLQAMIIKRYLKKVEL